MTTIRFAAYNGFGREIDVDVAQLTHWERADFNGVPGVRLHLVNGREIAVAGYINEIGNRIALAKDAALRQRANLTVSPVVVAAAKAVVQQLAHPDGREDLDLDLVTAVCTYLMEQAS